MFPILYEQITAGVVPQHNGLGVLSDCERCECEQVRNGIYEVVFEYPKSGLHASEIAARRLIKVKPNPTDNPQLFRIKRISKTMNGKFTVYCKHVSYDLSGCEITSGTAESASAACLLLQGSASGYTIDTDKNVSAHFSIDTPASVRSYFGGKAGSFLDVYGTSEIKYDNFHVSFLLHAGADRGVTIRYKKNLLELSQEMNAENLYTHVLCYWKKEGTKVVGTKVATGLTLDVPNTLVVDCSNDYQTAPSVNDLTTKATDYINSHNLTTPTDNITLDFVQSGDLVDRVDLCDTVSIYYEALGITRANAKCIRTKYDCLREKYIETEFGDVKEDLADTIAVVQKEVADKPSTSTMEQAITRATELITGNLGGYVVMHDTNNDGEPDEILIMDTDSILTATKVWRWNSAGLAYSSQGYDPTKFDLAITANGEIVADYITTGTLVANLIKAGVLSDVAGNSTIDMTNGEATLYQLKAKNKFSLINSSNTVKASLTHQVNGGSTFRLFTNSGDLRAALFNDPAGGDEGTLYLYNHYNQLAIRLEPTSNGDAYLYLYDQTGAIKTFIGAPSTGGFMLLYDNGGNASIDIDGQLGKITCRKMSVTQQTAYNISMSGAWSSVDEFTIYRMGNLCYVRLVLLGDGTSVASGANGATGTLTDGDLPIVDAKLVEYYGNNAIIANIDTSGNITVRNVGAAIAVAVGGKIELSGSFMVA